MDVIERAMQQLAALQGQVTSEILKDLINDHGTTRARMMTAYERYKASSAGVPIYSRTFTDTTKINNKLANDYVGEIVDVKVGYFMGKPVAYQLDRTKYQTLDPTTKEEKLDLAAYDKQMAIIEEFNLRNSVDDLDGETAKMAAVCGLAARLCYIDTDGQERVMAVSPWECIFVTDRSINECQFALRYYTVLVQNAQGRFEERTRVEWYDAQAVAFFVSQPQSTLPGQSSAVSSVANLGSSNVLSNMTFAMDTTESVNPKPHLFDGIPLIAFPNNEERQGDADKVLSLIDSYDRTLSDVSSEIEQFRMAYLAFYGMEVDEATIEKAKKTGAFGLPDIEAKMEFITKNLNDAVVEHHIDRLEQNILRFGRHVNFNDEAFGGNISGVAMKFKLFGLESKCITAERKFMAAIRQQFKVICSAWAKKNVSIEYTDIFAEFKRNFPLNLLDEADSTMKLKGMVSERTRLSLLSFVDDVDYELELMKKDKDGMVDLDMVTDEAVDKGGQDGAGDAQGDEDTQGKGQGNDQADNPGGEGSPQGQPGNAQGGVNNDAGTR